jgi:hypothetical protein
MLVKIVILIVKYRNLTFNEPGSPHICMEWVGLPFDGKRRGSDQGISPLSTSFKHTKSSLLSPFSML